MCERHKSDYHDEWFPTQREVVYKTGNLNDPEDELTSEESPNAHLDKTALAKDVHNNNFYYTCIYMVVTFSIIHQLLSVYATTMTSM